MSNRQKKRILMAWWLWLKMDEQASSPWDVKDWLDEFFRKPLDEVEALLREEFEDFTMDRGPEDAEED